MVPALISPSWLSAELANGFGLERDQVVLEVGYGPPDRNEHIPHSIWLDTNDIESDTRCWKLVRNCELLARFAQHGISRYSTVVVSGETLAAARVSWALSYAGVREVKILDGGFRRWTAETRSVVHGWSAPRRLESFGASAPAAASARATRQDVEEIIHSGKAMLADVRSRDEHEGATSGYPYIRKKGRIPGSVFARGGPDVNHLADYTHDDGRFLEPERVDRMWRELGIAGRVCFYCGTGWRASVAYLFARWLGFAHASVYDGGWFDWTALGRSQSMPRAGCV
jgi:thiosulfate/3-mercaptopyruvate sulfurtransferase